MTKHISYNIKTGVLKTKSTNLTKLITGATASIVFAIAFSVPVFAASSNGNGTIRAIGTPSSTTLDACGYFVGTQVSTQTHIFTTPSGMTHDNQKGTWTGVENNYSYIPVKSLGLVSGTYTENTTTSNGMVRGTEEFHSSEGNISQQFSFTTSFTSFNVNVQATGKLAFLTSNTNGHCYSGPVPRL